MLLLHEYLRHFILHCAVAVAILVFAKEQIVLVSYIFNLFECDLGVAVKPQLGTDGTELGIAVDDQLGAIGLFDEVVDLQSTGKRVMRTLSLLDPSNFLRILLNLGFLFGWEYMMLIDLSLMFAIITFMSKN